MNSVITDMKDKLVAGSKGTFAGALETAWNIYLNGIPPKPNKVIVLYSTSSPPRQGYADRSHPATEYGSFQMKARSLDDVATENKLIEVAKYLVALAAFNIVTAGEYDMHYAGITWVSDVSFFEKDENSRYIYTCTLQAIREQKHA